MGRVRDYGMPLLAGLLGATLVAGACSSRSLPVADDGAAGTSAGSGGGESGAGGGGGSPAAGGGSGAPAASGGSGSGRGGVGGGAGAGAGSTGSAGALAGSGGAPHLPIGAPCTVAAACQTGFCIDGVCCNSSCDGACRSCAAAASVGTCMAVPAGLADPHGVCIATSPASCGSNGLCDGGGGCRRYQAGTICSEPVCASSTRWIPAGACDAVGACVIPEALECAPYVCTGSRCVAADGGI